MLLSLLFSWNIYSPQCSSRITQNIKIVKILIFYLSTDYLPKYWTPVTSQRFSQAATQIGKGRRKTKRSSSEYMRSMKQNLLPFKIKVDKLDGAEGDQVQDVRMPFALHMPPFTLPIQKAPAESLWGASDPMWAPSCCSVLMRPGIQWARPSPLLKEIYSLYRKQGSAALRLRVAVGLVSSTLCSDCAVIFSLWH